MAPTTETLEGGGRRAQGISQRSFLVITRQPKVLPPPETTQPFFFFFNLKLLCVCPAGELKLHFLYPNWRWSVFPWTEDKSDLQRGGDCSFSGDTISRAAGAKVKLQLFCPVWRSVREDQGGIRSAWIIMVIKRKSQGHRFSTHFKRVVNRVCDTNMSQFWNFQIQPIYFRLFLMTAW